MRIRKAKDIMDEQELLLIARASDALAHPARVQIFKYIYNANIARETVCNKDLVEAFDYSQATISQHMAKLSGSGLVDVKKDGNKSLYYVSLGTLQRYLSAVKKLNE